MSRASPSWLLLGLSDPCGHGESDALRLEESEVRLVEAERQVDPGVFLGDSPGEAFVPVCRWFQRFEDRVVDFRVSRVEVEDRQSDQFPVRGLRIRNTGLQPQFFLGAQFSSPSLFSLARQAV